MTLDLAERAGAFFSGLQDRICEKLQVFEKNTRFVEDRWNHEPDRGWGSGGGVTRVLADGAVLEKGSVNLSAVRGELSPALASRLEVAPQRFFATGISLILHPRSPMVPTVHMNVRFIELLGDSRRAWFGGGIDLTPFYLFEEDVKHFHRCLRAVCERHSCADYKRFKTWCDTYFRLEHRGECRGVGGIFFDYLEKPAEEVFAFARDTAESFLPAYLPILERRVEEPWSESERNWQLHRRGRYVEFNLLRDRGTLFGLETRGRVESILVSLPPLVRWTYDYREQPESREAELLRVLRQPVDWT